MQESPCILRLLASEGYELSEPAMVFEFLSTVHARAHLHVTLVVHVDQKPSCEEVPKWVNFARDFRILTSHFSWTFLFPPDFRPAKDWPIKNTNNFILLFFRNYSDWWYFDQKKARQLKPHMGFIFGQIERYFDHLRLVNNDEMMKGLKLLIESILENIYRAS